MPQIIGYSPAYYGNYDPNKGYIPFVGKQPIYGQQPVAGTPVNTVQPVQSPYTQPAAPIVEAQVAASNVKPVQPVQTTAVQPAQVTNSPYAAAGTVTNINGTQMTSLGNGAWTQTNGNGWFDKGINTNGQTTFGGATGYEWGSLGLNTAFGLFNAYQGYKAQKLAQQQFEDQKRLNHANYRMQAKAFNNNVRNQQSGRGYIGMSGSAKRALGAEYQTRKAEDDY